MFTIILFSLMNKACYNIFGRTCYCKTNCLSCQEKFTEKDPIPADLQSIRQCKTCLDLRIEIGVERFDSIEDEEDEIKTDEEESKDKSAIEENEEERIENISNQEDHHEQKNEESKSETSSNNMEDESSDEKIVDEVDEEERNLEEPKHCESTGKNEQEEEFEIDSLHKITDENIVDETARLDRASGLFAVGGGQRRTEPNQDFSDDLKSGTFRF